MPSAGERRRYQMVDFCFDQCNAVWLTRLICPFCRHEQKSVNLGPERINRAQPQEWCSTLGCLAGFCRDGTAIWGKMTYGEPPIEEEKKVSMNYDRAVFVINDDVRCVLVSYDQDWRTDSGGDAKPPPRDKWTEYKTLDQNIEKGDFVVVPTGTRYGMTVCRVEEVDHEPDLDSGKPMKWIIGTVDRTTYEQHLAAEKEMIEQFKKIQKEQKRQELRKTLIGDDEGRLKNLALAHQKK